MAVIRASCPDCGDVELTTHDVHVRVCTADSAGSYHFRCPRCAMTVVKPAEARTVDLLTTSGVACSSWDLPLEMSEPRPTGTSFTHDDLIDFHALLEDEHRLARELDALAGR